MSLYNRSAYSQIKVIYQLTHFKCYIDLREILNETAPE